MSPRPLLAVTAGCILLALGLRAAQTPAPDTPFHPRPARVPDGAKVDGSAVLTPATCEAGAVGAYVLRVTIGRDGLPPGGALLVGFPKAWFVNPYPIPKHLQTTDRAKPHFLSVTSSRPGLTFALTVDTTGFSGKIERFNQTIAAKTAGATLQPGDIVSIALANTTCPYIADADEVSVAVDRDGTGHFSRLTGSARYQVSAGPVQDFTLLAPTEAVVGRPVQLQLTAFDRFWNVADTTTARAGITGLDGLMTIRLTADRRGTTTFNWSPARASFYFPEASIALPGRSERLAVHGNPIRAFAFEPAVKTYWGELHSHSSISADGIGIDPFPYARDAARLDFFAATEHADDDGNPRGNAIRPEDWAWIKGQVARFNQPGRFVTLLAYESSFPAGHHNVFFRSSDGVPWPAATTGTVQNLWARIAAGEAITIPHHTGISFMGPPPGSDSAGPELQPIITNVRGPVTATGNAITWSIHDPIRRPLLEIYSLHGSSEVYDPADALSYENAGFTFSRSVPGAHYARDAWASGLELGVVAATDNHSAQPGQPQGGATAVRASRLERGAVFDALAAKQTYGTTGQRVYLDVTIGGIAMGQHGRARGPLAGTLTIAAPSAIARVELLRRDLPAGEFVVAAHWDNQGKLLQTNFTDAPASEHVMYYVRVQLADEVRGRVVRAWSSPIWVDIAS
ncbi:MAG: DUF3604 domain-containing protein [Acidobacteriota bacterium]